MTGSEKSEKKVGKLNMTASYDSLSKMKKAAQKYLPEHIQNDKNRMKKTPSQEQP